MLTPKSSDSRRILAISGTDCAPSHLEIDWRLTSIFSARSFAVITADGGIYKAARLHGFDALLIESGGVSLEGFPYGFFGGCCGKISENKLFVNGSIKNHPSGDKIRSFLEKQDVEIVEGANTPPADIGSLIVV